MKHSRGPMVIVLFCLMGCSPGESPTAVSDNDNQQLPVWTATHVDAMGADSLLKEEKVIVLDVRTPEEYGDGHVEAAMSLNFYDDDFADRLAELDPGRRYLVYCRTGGRSTKTLDLLKKLGFQHVAHLDGGFQAWRDAGLPIEH